MAGAWSLSLVEHGLGVVRFAVIAGAPLLLGAALLAVDPAPRSLPRRVLVVLTLWCVIEADIALLAGLLHRFDWVTVLAAELLILAAAGAVLLRQRETWRHITGAARHEAQRAGAPERMVLLALALVGVSLLWHCAAVPVIDWDSWAFHMPSMARWLQAGEFVRLEQYALRPRNGYPYTWEAVSALFMMPFGEDTLVTFPSLVAWVLLGLATFAAARDLSAGRLHALAAAVFVMSMPHLQGQVNSLHIDLPFAAFFIAALSFALSYHRRRRRSDLALLVAALGFLCGLRTTGPIYAAALAAFLLAMRRWAAAPVRSRPFAAAYPALVAFCAASGALIGSFWWLRNLADYGNVLGPVALTAADVSAATFDRSLPALTSTALLFAFDPFAPSSWTHVAGRAWNEIGLPLPIMLAQLALWPAALHADRRPQVRQAAIVTGVLVIASLALFIATPLSADSGIQLRLGFPAMGGLAIAGAVAATSARLPGLVSACLAIAVAVLTGGSSRVFQLGAVLSVPAAIALRWRPSRAGCAALAGLLGAGLVVVLLVARERRERQRLGVYGAGFAYLEQHVGEDEPLGYLLSERSYYFYGARLRRPVRYMPLPDEGPTPQWFAQLRAAGIRAVAIGPYEGSEATPETLARLLPPHGELVPVFGQGRPGEITVYRFANP